MSQQLLFIFNIRLIFLLFLSTSIFAQNPVRDTTFGQAGLARLAIGSSNEEAVSVLVQPDDKIIAAGTQTDNPTFGPQNFALVRYHTNGDLDSSFGANGIVISSFLSQNFLNVICLQSDGKILAAGQSSVNFCIARYNNNGSIDSAFGTNGVTMLPSNIGSAVSDLKIFPNGDIIAAGTNAIPGTSYEMKMVRLNNIGLVDSTFGINGEVSSNLGFVKTVVRSVLIQANNKIVIGGRGEFLDSAGTTISQMFLARYLETGFIDSTYGVDGVTSYPFALNTKDMSFDANGNIVAVGEIGLNGLGTSGDIIVMRFTPNGFPDSTFGTNGSVVISVDSYADYANAVLLQADGKILVGGSYFNFGGSSVTDCLVIRFLENGMPDSTFGVNGVFKAGVAGGTDQVLDMAMDSENKIVFSGSANFNVNFDFIVVRLIIDLSSNSIGELTHHSELILFPNPAKDILNVHHTQAKITDVSIFNLFGQIVYSDRIPERDDFQIDVSTFGKGIYILKLNSDSGVMVKKFAVVE